MTELCERYRVSRPTGYKWVERWKQEGDAGLEERSRTPVGCPHRTPERLEERILALRAQHGWGAKKILQILERRSPSVDWPARSTVNAILDRHGKLHKKRRKKKWQETVRNFV